MRLEAIRCIIPISCRHCLKSVWITDKQWIGFLVAIAVISFEHLSCRGFLSFYYTLKVNIFTTGVVPWKYIIYPLMLSFATALLTTVTIRRKDFFR